MIRTRIAQPVEYAPAKPLYKLRGTYRISPREENGGTWYDAIDVDTGLVVRRITHAGIHWIYRAPKIKRLREMLRAEMPGWTEEEASAVPELRAVQGVARE